MAAIALRDYIERVETMLAQGQYDRVIRYCQHALRTSPRCVAFYRLLGQACMESGRPDDAADMFRRVLGVDPQSFVARVGLGVVAEGAGALDEADWQWSRALELEPDNGPVREELRGLRARMGQAAPGARLHLSRAALGYIYMRGEQYARAAEEFRAVLRAVSQNGAAEHDRYDMQIALAEALFRAGHRREAADLCQAVLKILPNALKANLILGGIFKETDRADEAAPLFERAAALDPLNRLAGSLLNGAAPASSPDIVLDEPASGPLIAPLPAAKAKPAAEPAPAPAAEAAPPPVAEPELPDWLVSLRSAAPETPAGPAVLPPAPPLSESTEPEWLRALQPAPSDAVSPALAPEAPAAETELPDWLKELRAPAATEPAEAAAPTEPAPPAPQPEVIAPPASVPAEPAAIEPPAPLEPVAEPPVLESEPTAASVQPPPAAELAAATDDGMPQPGPTAESVQPPPAVEPPAPIQPPPAAELAAATDDGMPQPGPTAESVQPAPPVEPSVPSQPPAQAQAEALATATDDGMPEMPEWLKALQARAAESAPPKVEPPPAPPPPPEPPKMEPVPDMPDWLKALRAETPPAPSPAPREASVYLDDAAAPPSVEAQPAPTGEAEHRARLELARMLVDLDVDEALDQYAQLGTASPAVRQQALDDVTALARDLGAHPHAQTVLAQLAGEAAAASAATPTAERATAAPAAEPAELEQMVAEEVTTREPAEPVVSEEAVEAASAEPATVEPETPAMPIIDETIAPPAPPAARAPREASVYLDDASAPPSVERQEVPRGAAEYRAWLDLARALKFIDVAEALDQYARLGGAPADVRAEAIKDLGALAPSNPRAAQLLAQLSGSARPETPGWVGEAQANLPTAAPAATVEPIVDADALAPGAGSQAEAAAPPLPIVDEEIMDEPAPSAPAAPPAAAPPAGEAPKAAVSEKTAEPVAPAAPPPPSAPREATAYLEDASAPPSVEAQAAPTGEAEHQARLELARTLGGVDLSESLAQYRLLIDAKSDLMPQVITDLQAIIARDPQARAARVCLADALTHAGRLVEAIEQYRLMV